MDSKINNNEKLYRVVKLSKPQLWDAENGRPSSALFKDSKGVSVDRDGNRNEKEIIKLLSENAHNELLRAAVYLESSFCYKIPVKLIAKPIENNQYHAEIHNSDEKIELTKSKAKKLSKNCEVIPIDKQ